LAPKKQSVFLFIQDSCRQREHGLRSVFFPARKPIAVELKKKDADNKPRALVAVHEGMITHDPSGIGGTMRMMSASVE
jgi:hypothetical protein